MKDGENEKVRKQDSKIECFNEECNEGWRE